VASYRLLIKPSAAKELEALPRKDRRRTAARMLELAAEPRPPGSEKLKGFQLYRVRQGGYRVVYEVLDRDQTVTVIKIGHRRDVYR
jgi:mRNA interferase RelE/StbE